MTVRSWAASTSSAEMTAGGHFATVPSAAIDRDDDRDLRPAQQRLVELGPGLENDEPFSALALPQLLGKVRRKRAEHAGHPESRGFPRLLPAPAPLEVVLHQVGELHQRRDRRIEAKGVDVARDPIDRLVQLAGEVLRTDRVRLGDRLVLFADDQAPDTVQESGDAVNASIVPFGVQLRWPDN